MPPRATWKGFLRLSLVTCPILLYPATSSSERVTFNRINRKTGQRVRQLNVDGKTGEKVEADDIVKGYEIDKGRYVLVEDEELAQIQVEATKIINVTQFVDAEGVDDAYLDAPYYVAPDGDLAEETFRVIRTAMAETGTAGLGSIVMTNRERRVLIQPKGRGIALTTLRTGREVRPADAYFESVVDEAVDPELLDMAKQLIAARRTDFSEVELVDTYAEAVKALIASKTKGEVPVFEKVNSPGTVVDLMKALKQSLEKEGGTARKPAARGKRKEPAKAVPAPKKAARKAR
jgi:DNA end-binding protein Ku